MSYNLRENTQHSFVKELKQFSEMEVNQKLKTFNSNQSALDYYNNFDTNLNIELHGRHKEDNKVKDDIQSYFKWKNQVQKNPYSFSQKQYFRKHKTQNKNNNQREQEQQTSYLLIQINSISNISLPNYSNHQNNLKQYFIKIICTLQNPYSGYQYPKQIISPLMNLSEQRGSKNKTLCNNEKITLFLHTKSKKLSLKISVILYQILNLQNGSKITTNQQLIGGTIIQLLQNKQTKTKRKKNLSKIQNVFQNIESNKPVGDQSNQKNIIGTVGYNIINYQFIKIISKLIPQNAIFWYKDVVPCLLGKHLPKDEDASFNLNPSTENFSVSLDIQNILIPTNFITKVIEKFQLTINKQYKNLEFKTHQKGLRIQLLFHNGLVIVQNKISNLIEKMQIQKKVKKTIASKNDIITFKQYNSNVLFIPTAFFQQNCLLILQIYAEIQIQISRKSINQNKNIKNINQHQIYLIPVAFTYLNSQKISNNQQIQRKLILGYFSKCDQLKLIHNLTNEHQLKSFNHLSSNKNIQQNEQNFHPVVTMKVQIKEGIFGEDWQPSLAKLDQKLIKEFFGDKSFLKNDSIKLANEKQKMVRGFIKKGFPKTKQTKRLILKPQIVKIQMKVQQQSINNINKKAKQAQLLIIQHKLDHLKIHRKEQKIHHPFQNFLLKANKRESINQKFVFQRIYKKTLLKLKINLTNKKQIYSPKIRKMAIRRQKQFSYQNYQQSFQQAPIELIKTNLIDSSLKHLILINPISLIPTIGSNNKNYIIPYKFFIKIAFWNFQSCSPLLTIDVLTGEIVVCSSQKEKVSKILNFQVNPDSNFLNYQQYLVSFIEFIYNVVIQVQIFDQSTTLFGNSWFKLRELAQKIKNENISTIQQEVYSQNQGVVAKLKMDFKYLKRRNYISKLSQQLIFNNSQLSKVQNSNSLDKQNSLNLNKIMPANQLQRINNFKKKNKQRFSQTKLQMSLVNSQNLKDLKKDNSEKGIIQAKYHENIKKTIEKEYLVKQYQVKVCMFTKEIFIIQLQNKFNQSGFFNIQISDQDLPYYQNLYPQQLTFIKNTKNIPKSYLNKFMVIQKNKEKLLKHKQLQQNFEIFLEPYQKVSIICQYHSYRRYCQTNFSDLQRVNHQHEVIVSLLLNKNVSSIVKIKIVPQPIKQIIKIEQYCEYGKQYFVELPFKEQDLQFYEIMIDDPKVLLVNQEDKQMEGNKLIQNSHIISKDKSMFTNQESNLQTDKNKLDSIRESLMKKQSIYQQSNQTASNSSLFLLIKKWWKEDIKTINVYFIPKENSLLEQTIQDFLTIKSKAKLVNIMLNTFSAKQLSFKVNLFQTLSQKLFIYHKDISLNSCILNTIGIASSSQCIVFNEFWNKINSKQTQTIVNMKITSLVYGKSSFIINILNPNKYNEAIQNENGFQLEDCIIYRYLIIIYTSFPTLKQLMTLNINQRQSQVIEQWFSYANNYNQKTVFQVLSSHSQLIYVSEKDNMIQVNGKSQKKLKLIVDCKKILTISHQINFKQIVILGFKCQKGIDYFGFKFNIK